MDEAAGFRNIRRVLRVSSYRNFLLGNFCAHLGTWSQRIATQFLTWELTHSPTWLGIIAFADLWMPVILAPLAGALADRFDRLRVLLLLLFISFLISAALAITTLTGIVTIEIVLGLALTNGVVMSFNYPVRLAVIHGLVDRNALTSAISINSLTIDTARFGGPALAGLIIVNMGVEGVFFIAGLAYLAFLLALYRVRLLTDEAPGERGPARHLPAEILDGFRYTVNHPGIGPLLLVLAMLAIFAQPYTELLQDVVDKVPGQGVTRETWPVFIGGISGLLCLLFLARRVGVQGLVRFLTTNILVVSVALICFAPNILLFTLVSSAVVAWAWTVFGIGGVVLLQASVAGVMRGRVLSIYYVILAVGALAGKWTVGLVSEFIGTRWSFFLAAVLCLLLWLWARKRQDRMAASLEADPERGHG